MEARENRDTARYEKQQLTALGKEHSLKNAPHILAKVRKAVARWRHHAAEAGVSSKSTEEIAGSINQRRK